MQVREWARSAFEAEVHPSKQHASINLGKASMLIALEEEAAIEALHATNPPLMEQVVQRHVRQKGSASEREWERDSGISEAPILWYALQEATVALIISVPLSRVMLGMFFGSQAVYETHDQ